MTRSASFLVLLVWITGLFVSSASSVIYACEYFTSSVCEADGATNNAMMNYGSCYFSACGGHEVVISNYQNCVGDTFLRLYDSAGNELSYHDDVYWDYDNMDNCSEISFTLPKSTDCQRFESRVGCWENTDCSAQVTINVTESPKEYVRDVIRQPEGDSWTQGCPKFNVTGSLEYFDPSQTSVCSFELCPGEYFNAFIRNCVGNTQVDLFSYSDVQFSNYNLACEEDEDNFEVAKLYFDTIGHDSCRLFSFYSFCDSGDTSEYCSGQVVLTKKTFPTVNITWSDASFTAQEGDTLQFTLSDMAIDYNYWDYGEVSFWVVVYKTDMLENQEHCGYRDFTSNDFYDYVGYFEWFTVGGEYTVLTGINGSAYTVDSFGGNYTAVLYAWGDSFHAVSPLSSSATLSLQGTSHLDVAVHEYVVGSEGEQDVSGSWKFASNGCVAGDVVKVVPVDHEGFCSVHGEVAGTFDSHVYKDIVCDSSTFTSAAVGATSGSFEFTIPHCAEHASNVPKYEIQYIRNHIVLGRMLAVNASVVPAHDSNSSKDGYFNTLGLEHLLVFFSIVAVLSFAVAYVFRSRQQKTEMYGGLSCFSAHDYDKEVMLNEDMSSSSSYHL